MLHKRLSYLELKEEMIVLLCVFFPQFFGGFLDSKKIYSNTTDSLKSRNPRNYASPSIRTVPQISPVGFEHLRQLSFAVIEVGIALMTMQYFASRITYRGL